MRTPSRGPLFGALAGPVSRPVGFAVPGPVTRILSGEITGPALVAAPVITGTAYIGNTLTCSTGTWEGTGTISYAYQWLRDGAPIEGATASTYVLVAADDSTSVSCAVTATDDTGSRSSAAAPVSATYAPPVNTVAPVVSGDTGLGDVLSVTNGTWTGANLSFAYQWRRDGAPISGATSSSYMIVLADDAALIRCDVTATNSGGSETAQSNSVQVNDFAAPVISGVPTIAGSATLGSTLTATAASVTGDPAPTRTWQWYRGSTPIAGATSDTYEIVADDVGFTLKVRQTETNVLGADSADSAPTDPVVDTVPWLPTDSADLWAWWDASDATTVTLNGATVAQVDDKSGADRHIVQGVGASQPLYDLAVQNGLNVLRSPPLQGAATLDQIYGDFPSTDFTMIAVARIDDAGGNDSVMALGFTGNGNFQMAGLADFQPDYAPYVAPGAPLPYVGNDLGIIANGPSVYAYDVGQSESFLTVDGAVIGVGLGGSRSGDARVVWFANRAANSSPTGWTGEFVICTNADRQKVEGYMAWKWGLQANLPADHPYKSAAPTV